MRLLYSSPARFHTPAPAKENPPRSEPLRAALKTFAVRSKENPRAAAQNRCVQPWKLSLSGASNQQ